MSYTPLDYVKNGVEVRNDWVDTVTTGHPNARKTVEVKNFNYKADMFVISDDPGEVILGNLTGDSTTLKERVRYGLQKISNLAQSIGLSFMKGPTNTGRKALIETITKLDNIGVDQDGNPTGDFCEAPIKIQTTIVVPDWQSITGQAIKFALDEHLGSLYATDSDDGTLIVNMLRGKLNPTQ